MSSSPLATLCVVAYRQEQFVREAVASAFAQTYSPLEIILSDDSSPDATYAIMCELAAAYRGPHQVRLNRTPRNLGLSGHVNMVWNLARGDFLVAQAGDDRSLPHRTGALVQAWNHGAAADLVVSHFRVMDSQGVVVPDPPPIRVVGPLALEEVTRKGRCYASGCAVGFDRRLATHFGPLDPRIIQEDWVLAFRALLGRGIKVLPAELLERRQHGTNLCFGSAATLTNRTGPRRFLENRLAIYEEWLRAWDFSGRPRDSRRRRLHAHAERSRSELLCCDRTWPARLGIVLGAPLRGVTWRDTFHLLRRQLLSMQVS